VAGEAGEGRTKWVPPHSVMKLTKRVQMTAGPARTGKGYQKKQ
jgi:hypothetical protein